MAATDFWGDSLTNFSVGTGSTMTSAGYTSRDVYHNAGIAGDTSSDVLTRFSAAPWRKHWNQVIWVGQNWNSQSQIVSDIATMVNSLTHSRFLIISAINDGNSAGGQGPSGARYLELKSLASALQSIYGAKWYDLRGALVAYGISISDAASLSYDAPPTTYQPTDVHLNTAGYIFSQNLIRAKLYSLGYMSPTITAAQIGLSGGT